MSPRRPDAGAAVAGLFANPTATGGLAGRHISVPAARAIEGNSRTRERSVRVRVELGDVQITFLRGLSRRSPIGSQRPLGAKFVAAGNHAEGYIDGHSAIVARDRLVRDVERERQPDLAVMARRTAGPVRVTLPHPDSLGRSMTDARLPPATTTQQGLPGEGGTNKQYFAGKAFDSWAHREGLTDEEAFLVERFLDGGKSTLEAGTGGGRILLDLRERGFADLHGFDYVPEFIDVAMQRDVSRSLQLSVQSAVALNYPDEYFEQAIYLQQVLCFIEARRDRFAAMREARRVLKPGGTALLSFLCYEARMKTPLYAAFATYLQVTRAVRGRVRSLQYQPWLKNDTKPNFSALLDRPPYVYCYTIAEAVESLENAGFSVIAAGSHAQLRRHELLDDPARLDGSNVEGMLYLVCTRQ